LVIFPTRLETRTKEFIEYASHWVLKLKGVMKVKALLDELICDPGGFGHWVQHSPVSTACSGAEVERTR